LARRDESDRWHPSAGDFDGGDDEFYQVAACVGVQEASGYKKKKSPKFRR
jgi:hypothetical protein